MVNWASVVAYLINTVLVVLVVNWLKSAWPGIKERFPWLLPLIPSVVAPIILAIGDYLTRLLGFPIDLQPIIGVLTGVLAAIGYDIGDGLIKQQVNLRCARGGKK